MRIARMVAGGAGVAALVTASAAGVGAGPNQGNGKKAEVDVVFTCDGITATSTKDISNVVVSVGGEEIKFDGLSGYTYVVEMTGIDVVWVKSGSNRSGDGPGYGERFERDDLDCTEDPGGEEEDPGEVETPGDTDGDGLPDAVEIEIGTDPNDHDSDDDGLDDGTELVYGTDPNDADSDDDGLHDGAEIDHLTDPMVPDTDGGGVGDGDEVEAGTNPTDPGDDGGEEAPPPAGE